MEDGREDDVGRGLNVVYNVRGANFMGGWLDRNGRLRSETKWRRL